MPQMYRKPPQKEKKTPRTCISDNTVGHHSLTIKNCYQHEQDQLSEDKSISASFPSHFTSNLGTHFCGMLVLLLDLLRICFFKLPTHSELILAANKSEPQIQK